MIRRARDRHMPTAARCGRAEDARRALGTADAEERHYALALAAAVRSRKMSTWLARLRRESGSLYPLLCHSHSTPRTQGRGPAGHDAVVRVLVGRGARLDIRDIWHNGTPLGWAEYAKQHVVAAYLRSRGAEI